MSGKFMKVKKIAVATLTMLMIASQLAGCAGVTQQEAIDMVNRQDTIEIEIAVPNTEVENTEIGENIQEIEWKELGYMDNYPEFREEFDLIVGNSKTEDGRKTGICYVNMNMKWENNSCLRYVFNIPAFQERVWSNESTISLLNGAVREIYADVESDSEARLAAINAYYSIFNTPEGYFNGSDTLTRAEFLTGVYKAHNPVGTLEANVELSTDMNSPFVNQMLKYNYIDLINNNKAYDGAITRAEAIYTLVNMYYSDALEINLDDFKIEFSDAKSLGIKETNSKSTELNAALQNPDAGMPEELYRTLLVAAVKGLIGEETRWDEAITKTEALDMITYIYSDTDLNRSAQFEVKPITPEQAIEQGIINVPEQNQQGQEKANPQGYHLIKDAEGDIVCTSELREAIHTSLSKAGLEVNYRQEILNRYYEATLEMDNTEIHNDVIDNITSSLKKEIEVQQSVADEKKEQNNKKEETQQQKPSGDNVQVDDNGYIYEDNNEYPSGNIYEEEGDGPIMDDPTAGLEEITITPSYGGDGGDLVTDIEVKPAGE